MANIVLLTGAGFSKNWGGFVAREITNALMSQLQNNRHLLQALNRGNFEDVLSQVQSEYLATRTAETQDRLNAMQGALADVFGRMNVHFAARQFEFSNDIAHSIQKFLVRFDAIFTLNQDLLIEVHYNNQNVAIWHGTRWQGYELPGLREMPLQDPLAGRVRSKWVPQDRFVQTPKMQPYFKLHGSTAWDAADGSSLMVIGRNKVGLIRSNAILKWNYERFEEYLARPDTRLMVIGYGFADDHINATIVDAHQKGHLRLMYLVHPSGKAILDRYPTAAIRVPQPIMDIPCIECTALLSAAFSTDHMAQSLLEDIFAQGAIAQRIAPHAKMLNDLAVEPGQHIAHIGAGAGYYTAMLAELTGASGRVTAIEFGATLAEQARVNLAAWRHVKVISGDGGSAQSESVDRIYVNFGVTAPGASWIEHLKPGGKLLFALGVPHPDVRAKFPRYAAHGATFLIDRTANGFAARWLYPAYYVCAEGSLAGDADAELALYQAFERGGFEFARSLRWNEPTDPMRCWYWTPRWSLSFDALEGE